MKKTVKRSIEQYLGISLGAIFLAIAYAWFLVPYKIAPGGIAGLAQIFHHFFGLPTGMTMIVLNIPLFLLGAKMLGKAFGVRSFFGMFIGSVMTDLLNLENLYNWGIIKDISQFTYYTGDNVIYAMLPPEDIYLSAIAGSVLLGFGLGVIFRFKGSTGGTDIPVAIIKQKTGLSLGTGYWLIETFIIFTIGFVFKDVKLIIWGYINLFITSQITDIAAEGLPYVKAVFIISEFSMDIRAEIFQQLGRGITFIKAEGAFSRHPYDMIFCVISRRQVAMVRDIVKDIDPKAFVVVTDVADVMGLGFKSRSLDMKSE